MNNFDKPFLRTAFSESDGSGSFGRLTSALLILCVIVWDSIGMLYGGSIISGAEFTLQITGALLPYVGSKTASTIAEIKNPSPSAPPP